MYMLVPELAATSQRRACICYAAATSQALEITTGHPTYYM